MRSLLGPRTGWAGPTSFEEALRVVRSNLDVAVASTSGAPIVAVTSPAGSEGTTLVACSLAAAFAAAGRRTVLADLDLRQPDAHRVLGAAPTPGVSDLLLGKQGLDGCLQQVATRSPDVTLGFVAAGPAVAEPGELLAGPATAELLSQLAAAADIVVLDCPPVLPVADTLAIGRSVTGAVVVAEARRTDVAALRRACDVLARNQTSLFGVVVNKSSRRDGGSRTA